jgi:hypothetical protein
MDLSKEEIVSAITLIYKKIDVLERQISNRMSRPLLSSKQYLDELLKEAGKLR